jgi:hypothetical protein
MGFNLPVARGQITDSLIHAIGDGKQGLGVVPGPAEAGSPASPAPLAQPTRPLALSRPIPASGWTT